MFSHARKLIPVAGLALLAGCGDAAITAPSSPDEAFLAPTTTRAADVGAMVPIQWTYQATATGADLVYCQDSDERPVGLAIPENYTVAGRMSHLGRLDPAASTAMFTDCVADLLGGVVVGGVVAELVGANGDAVFMAGALTLHLADAIATGEWSITGGSGRFEGAGGWMETSEQPTLDGSASVGGGQGMITPPGVLLR